MKDKIKNDFLLIALLLVIVLILFLFGDWINDNSNALMVISSFELPAQPGVFLTKNGSIINVGVNIRRG